MDIFQLHHSIYMYSKVLEVVVTLCWLQMFYNLWVGSNAHLVDDMRLVVLSILMDL